MDNPKPEAPNSDLRLPISPLTERPSELRQRINASLLAYTELGEGCPSDLQEAMRYALLAPGKRLRPILVLLAAEACGGMVEAALPAACAVEMVHAYSLVHDDLPAMDDDDLRRGSADLPQRIRPGDRNPGRRRPTDLGIRGFGEEDWASGSGRSLLCGAGRAAGACHLVGGQADDVTGQVARAGIEALESIHRRKTGAMILVSLRLGALVAGADATRTLALEQYGRRIGLAFQITDDLLDVRGDEGAVGKRLHKDSDQGKTTYPGLLGIHESLVRARQLVSEACEALQPLGAKAEGLKAMARYMLERNS